MNKVQISHNHAPCRGCLDRHMRCHQSCVRYISWSYEKSKIAEDRHKRCALNDAIWDVKRTNTTK